MDVSQGALKILYHHRTQLGDAQGIHVHAIIKAFRELGHQVEVVALVDSQAPLSKPEHTGLWSMVRKKVPHIVYDVMSLGYNLFGIFMLFRAVLHKRPDFIYERYALNNFAGLFVSMFCKIPIVVEVNAPLYLEQAELGQLALKRLARFSEKYICSHATKTLAVSGVLKEILIDQGVPPDKITVMPNGIDLEVFNPNCSDQGLRRRYGFEDKVVVGFVGWFRPWHGVEMLLHLLPDLLSVNKNVRVLMVGDGPIYDELLEVARARDVMEAVCFTGSLSHSEIPPHIAAMDIAVQPKAPPYACPMKVLEYMGMGKCIVAPNQPNIRELLDDKVTGFLFQPNNKDSLKCTLLELLNNPKMRARCGEGAFKRLVSQKYYWKGNAEKVINLIFNNEPMTRSGSRPETENLVS